MSKGLRRELGLFSAVLYGLGLIIGAGIYSVIGIAAGFAGDMVWLSFLLAGIAAFPTALSYAELSSRIPRDAAEYNYTRKAFGDGLIPFLVEWMVLIGCPLFSATVALAFAGYFVALFGGQIHLVALGVIAFMTFIDLS